VRSEANVRFIEVVDGRSPHELSRATGLWPDFVWSIGEEGSDPIVDVDGVPFRHDQYAQSGHYDLMADDLRSIAGLGVEVVRYGMPWRVTEPERGLYDWALWDRALAACHDAGLTPVVDLLHFGLPDHYSGFADPAWVDGFCRYVDAFLARYPEPMWFTPVNEPGITATLTARWGLWNDRLATAADHARVLGNIVLANLEAVARICADRDGWWISSEGFDVFVDPSSIAPHKVERRQAVSWLVWDLHFGTEPLPAAARYLDPIHNTIRTRIADLAVHDHVVAGHDFYPTSVQCVEGPTPEWAVAERVAVGLETLRSWHQRYRQPFWISETSNLSLPVSEQVPWLTELVAGLDQLRSEGLPVRGLCWYSRGDQYDWQTALAKPTGAVTEVGLFDSARAPRPVAASFREFVGRDQHPPGRSPHAHH
jgi:beta-glucosidase/6-phospho-beta-glucosidase/beta-galactosidase